MSQHEMIAIHCIGMHIRRPRMCAKSVVHVSVATNFVHGGDGWSKGQG